MCPVLLPPALMMGQSNTPYNLHVNVPSDVRPVLTLRTTNLLPILPFFSAGLMECVVCVSDYDEVVFRLEARVSSTNGAESEISCLGETVSTVGPVLNALFLIIAFCLRCEFNDCAC